MMTLGAVGAFGFHDFAPHEVIGLYAKAGCTAVQAYRNRERIIPAEEIVRICDDLAVRISSLHAHFGDDLDPSSEDESIRAATLAEYEREAAYCGELGAAMMVIHPSPPRAPQGDVNRRHAQLQRSIEDFARLGEQTGVVCAIENMPPYHPVGADVRRLVAMVAGVGSHHVQFLLDFGHAHMTCGIVTAIEAAGPHLLHTHVHDNDGTHDTHLLPFRGTMPWDEARAALHARGYDGEFMLEVFESADDLRRLLTEEWRRNIRAILDNGR